jgi:hypothetical protein
MAFVRLRETAVPGHGIAIDGSESLSYSVLDDCMAECASSLRCLGFVDNFASQPPFCVFKASIAAREPRGNKDLYIKSHGKGDTAVCSDDDSSCAAAEHWPTLTLSNPQGIPYELSGDCLANSSTRATHARLSTAQPFLRVLHGSSGWKQFSARGLSSDPWIVALDNFASPD